MPAPDSATVLAFWPPEIRVSGFLMAHVAAQLIDGRWIPIRTPGASYPPLGGVYVPIDLLPLDLHPGQFAAWTVADQPDYETRGLAARFHATSVVPAPLEVVKLDAPADAAARDSLVRHEFDRGAVGEEFLVEFRDGAVARLPRKAAGSNGRAVVPADALVRPVPLWAKNELNTVTLKPLSLHGKSHRFAAEPEPNTAGRLDLASIEELLLQLRREHRAEVPAGSFTKDRDAIRYLQTLIDKYCHAWPAREARLRAFLAEATDAADRHEAWDAYVVAHPAFARALAAQWATMPVAEVRVEPVIVAAPPPPPPPAPVVSAPLTNGTAEADDRLRDLRAKCQQAERQLAEWSERVGRQRDACDQLARQAATERAELEQLAERRESQLARAGGGADAASKLFSRDTPFGHARPQGAVDHLRDNLLAVGIVGRHAELLARELYVALSLGQPVAFRGSLAALLADVLAGTLAGGRADQPADSAALAAGPVRQAALECLLGRRVPGQPAVIAALAESADSPAALGGPVFDTDCLDWQPGRAADLIPGRCDRGAWDAPERDAAADAPALLSPLGDRVPAAWRPAALRALARLTALAPADRDRSFLFGWVVPLLAARRLTPADCREWLRSGAVVEAARGDSRLTRLLDRFERGG